MEISLAGRVLLGTILICIAAVMAAPVLSEDQLRRGEYLATIMNCAGCHSTGALRGRPQPRGHLAGATVGFQVPGHGIVYPPNLTPDRETGLGTWSGTDIVKAVRSGVRPDGRVLAPAMPWHSFGALTDADAEALAAYLKTVKPVRHRVPAMVDGAEPAKAPFLALRIPE
ncbi:MAG: cytochrome c [Xanthobacteraceae bacterium]|nr:cytochrome c [Xanthobacteraceae bacterium]